MKRSIAFFFVLVFYSGASAQITLEHTYPNPFAPTPVTSTIRFAQVDSAEVMYFRTVSNHSDSIEVYNADHTLYKVINVPVSGNQGVDELFYLSRHLFNSDDKLEILCRISGRGIVVVDEDGNVVFECPHCNENYPLASGTGAIPESIVNTQLGTKMILADSANEVQVYSLPGRLPGVTSSMLGTSGKPDRIVTGISDPSAFPNPSSGAVRVTYSLPTSVSSGQLIVLTLDGKEVRRYTVGGGFSDIVIPNSDLASGVYLYKLVTTAGESRTQSLVVTH